MTAVLRRPDVAASRVTEADVRAALDQVVDPELDEPITDLGFVTSVAVDDGGAVVVHLRLPTSFCSPNFAWLMASDAQDAVAATAGVTAVTVELDDHHDSELINRGLAAGVGYRGTFRHEAEDSLDALRLTFQRKAHTAAMERALTALLRDGSRTEADVHTVTLGDLPPGDPTTAALRRRRETLGFSVDDAAPVLVDEAGRAVPAAEGPKRLRMARSVRISVDGNAHFCRGLLRTRYPGSGADQTPRPSDDDRVRTSLPLLSTTPRATAPATSTGGGSR